MDFREEFKKCCKMKYIKNTTITGMQTFDLIIRAKGLIVAFVNTYVLKTIVQHYFCNRLKSARFAKKI